MDLQEGMMVRGAKSNPLKERTAVVGVMLAGGFPFSVPI